MKRKILFSNIGYARGIDGTLWQHVCRFSRHFYLGVPTQKEVLGQLRRIIDDEKPTLCCLVEIDQGSLHSTYFNQLEALVDEHYQYHDIADKYGENSMLGRMPLHIGKSNAFLSHEKFPFERLYFTHGSKRLIYHLTLPEDLHVYFAHFSLQSKVRAKQFREFNRLVRKTEGDVIILADFNIMQGFKELEPLLHDTNLKVLNKEDEHTFTFHKYKWALDLCLCSENLLDRISLRVIPQPFSDHAALLVEV